MDKDITSITVRTKTKGMRCFTSFQSSSFETVTHLNPQNAKSSDEELQALCSPFKLCYCGSHCYVTFHSPSPQKTLPSKIFFSNMNSSLSNSQAPVFKRCLPPLRPLSLSLLFVVAKLNGQPVANAAERRRLHLPVVDGVREQTDAVIERPLHPKPLRAEVIDAHLADVVGVEVDHLENGA